MKNQIHKPPIPPFFSDWISPEDIAYQFSKILENDSTFIHFVYKQNKNEVADVVRALLDSFIEEYFSVD